MPVFEWRSPMPASSWELFQYHKRAGAFERLAPPWENIEVIRRTGSIKNGDILEMAIRKGPAKVRWTALHQDYIEGERFVDVQTKGPFSHWRHTHHFLSETENSALWDQIEWEPPLSFLSRPFARLMFEPQLKRMFRFRHRRTYYDLLRQRAYDGPPKTVVIAGGPNPLCEPLAAFLSTAGFRVFKLKSVPGGSYRFNSWFGDGPAFDPEQTDAIILTGAPMDDDVASEAAWSHLEYLCGVLSTMHQKLPLLMHLVVKRPKMDQNTANPGLDLHPSKINASRANEQKRLDLIDRLGDGFHREAQLYFGSLIRSPMGYLSQLLMRLETFLFLKDSARSPTFCWISLDDAVGAIHHLLCKADFEGELAVITPQPATRADLQQALIKRGLASYVGNRVLRVTHWSAPGKPAGMDPELLNMTPISDLGFSCINKDIGEAVAHELGDGEPITAE